MKEQLIIIGARGFGREVYNLALESKGYGVAFDIKGFLDSKTDALDGYVGYPPILDSVEDYVPCRHDVFICALGDTAFKKLYVEKIQAKGGRFISLVHQTALIDRNTTLGMGCIVCAYTHVSCDIHIGDFVTLQPFTMIGHDARIGDFCHLNCYSFMGGFSELEDEVTLQTGAKVLPHKKVGAGSMVGAGSVVVTKVKPGITVHGNPAVRIEF